MTTSKLRDRFVRWLASSPAGGEIPLGSPAEERRGSRVAFCGGPFPAGSLMGGAELNLFFIAREIASRGRLETLYLASSPNPELSTSSDVQGVRVYQPDERATRWQGLARRIKWTVFEGAFRHLIAPGSTWNAPSHPLADLYHFRCGGSHLGNAVHRCHDAGARVVFSPAHIQDCTLEWVSSSMRRGLAQDAYLWGLERVDLVTCHAEYLSNLVRDRVRCPVETIYAGHPVPPELGPKEDPPLVLYVSRMERWKRPDLFLDLVEGLAGVGRARFVMVGGPTPAAGRSYFDRIRERAERIPGLAFTGPLPLAEVESLFERASLFVSTSSSEGFPNTFIQAWLRKTPTASLSVDPDGLIERHELGVCARGDMPTLVRSCREILSNPPAMRALGAQARAYAVAKHDIRETARRHEALYLRLLEEHRGTPGSAPRTPLGAPTLGAPAAEAP